MKTLISLVLLFNLAAFAGSKQNFKQSAMPTPKGRLSTDVKFDDHLVNGKFQDSFDATSTVENEKDLDDLIGIRTSFKDRLKKSEGMR